MIIDAKNLKNPMLRGTEAKYDIYYDETNNVRKIYLDTSKPSKTNITSFKSFLIGGIVLANDKTVPDLSFFKNLLSLQKNINEIKFAVIAKNDFERVLTSRKLTILLQWMLDNDVNIHYQCTNTLYWSIVDIIDSLDGSNIILTCYNRELKNELYRIARFDSASFLNMLQKYKYPNVKKNETNNFIKDLNTLINNYIIVKGGNNILSILQGILKAHGADSLIFCTDEEDDILVENFTTFYRERICTFMNSIHKFDIEESIMEKIYKEVFKYDEKEIKYQFVDSKTSTEIQLSDVIAGLFGKYQDFIDTHKISDLIKIKDNLNGNKILNLELMAKLIEKADELLDAFIMRVVPLDCVFKSNYFLHDQEIEEILYSE